MDNQSNIDINLSLDAGLDQAKEELNKEKSIYSKDHLDKRGIEILTEMESKTTHDFIFEIIFSLLFPVTLYFIGINIINYVSTHMNIASFKETESIFNCIKALFHPAVVMLMMNGLIKALDDIAYMSGNIVWYNWHLMSHLLEPSEEYINQEKTEDSDTKVTEAENIDSTEYDEVKLMNQLESVCEYCGGLYIHGKDTKCPHCYAPIPKIRVTRKTV